MGQIRPQSGLILGGVVNLTVMRANRYRTLSVGAFRHPAAGWPTELSGRRCERKARLMGLSKSARGPFSPAVLFLALSLLAGIRGPGKYNGVVLFDRWGGCHLYGGAYVMEVSESVKGLLRPYANQPVLVDAKEVFQPMNPGDGLITKLEVLGPSVETTSATFGKPPLLEDLSLKAFANFSAPSGPELILELRNIGSSKRGVDMQALGPTLLAKKQGSECFDPSDGPSFVAVTRTNIDFMHQYPAGGRCVVNGKGIRVWLPPGVSVLR
jgi:hypothetical protein